MAKDIIHDAVKNALIKDGWQITHDPFRMEYEEIEVFADLAAERSPIVAEKEGQKIVVEIKTFAGRSFIRQLQQALGQYSLYLDIIELNELDYELYLAISHSTYYDFFLRKGTREIIERRQLKVLVVDVVREEIIQWF